MSKQVSELLFDAGRLDKVKGFNPKMNYSNFDSFSFTSEEQVETMLSQIFSITDHMNEQDFYRFMISIWNSPAIEKFKIEYLDMTFVFVPTLLNEFSSDTGNEFFSVKPIVDCYIYFNSLEDRGYTRLAMVDTLCTIERIVDNKKEQKVSAFYSYLDSKLESVVKMYDELKSGIKIGYDLYTVIQYYMKNRPEIYTEKKEYVQKTTVSHKKSGKAKHKTTNKVKVVKTYILKPESVQEMKTTHSKHNMTCDSWGVTGHYRHYKNGNVVWIKPYVKGKNREQYIGKEYVM